MNYPPFDAAIFCYKFILAVICVVAQLLAVSQHHNDMIRFAIICQLALLAYHQVTTLFDFFPFNGARNYSRQEKLAEGGSNFVLMILAPIGFGFHIHWLMIYGVVYYFFLFAVELIIWWVPYFMVPSGRWRNIYNRLLSVATSNFEKGDTLTRWCSIHKRLHSGTITFLPVRADRPVPNLEHTILHAWTLLTALVTVIAWRATNQLPLASYPW